MQIQSCSVSADLPFNVSTPFSTNQQAFYGKVFMLDIV